MSKFLSIIFMAAFSMVFAGLENPEKEQLFQRAGSEIVLYPERSAEVLDYIEKNFSLDQGEEDRLTYLKLKSFFFQNNFTEVLKIISKQNNELSGDLVILKNNILYSFKIPYGSFGSNTGMTEDAKLSEKIFKLLGRTENTGYRPGSAELALLLKDIKPDRVWLQRESLFNLAESLSRNDLDKRYAFFFEKINHLYKNDPAFSMVYISYLLKNNLFEEAGKKIAELPKESFEQSTNLNLKYSYYNLLVTFYAKTKQPENYKEAVQKREPLFRSINRTAFSAKNRWFGAVEENFRDELNSSQKKKRYFLFSFFAGAILLVVVLSVRLSRIRAKIKEYEEFTARLAFNKDKKTFQPQIISEKTENALLQKLQDFEKTTDFIHSDISLQNLAKKLDTNTKYLSEIINKHKHKNFNAYINELRIHYITGKLIENPVYRNYKIKYLAEESGFSTHSAFAAAFKTVNGISPAHYIQLLNHKEE